MLTCMYIKVLSDDGGYSLSFKSSVENVSCTKFYSLPRWNSTLYVDDINKWCLDKDSDILVLILFYDPKQTYSEVPVH